MEFEQAIPFLIGAFVVGIFVYNYFFSRNARINRRLKKAPWKKLADFKSGDTAKIVGEIIPIEDEMTAPLSKRKCCHYFIDVEQKKSSGKNSHWKTIIQEEVSTRFLIKDGDRYALVNDIRVMTNIVIDANFSSGTFDDAAPALESFLKDHGLQSENWLGLNKSIRYEEGILEANETVSVLGTGHWKPAAEFDLPAEYGEVLAIRAADDSYVYLSDDPETTEKNVIRPKAKPDSKSKRSKYYRTPNGTVGH